MTVSLTFTDMISGFSSDGKDFEHFTKWFLENDSRYVGTIKRVWLWNDWPGRWGKDLGIDLVAETVDGDLWAIQSKHYAESNSVSKAAVDSFLSESNRKRQQFAYRLLVMATNRLGSNAEQVMADQNIPCGIIRRADLEASTLNWEAYQGKVPVIRTPFALYDYQEKALQDVLAGFDIYWRGQYLSACGTGKTLTSQRIAEAVGGSTLVLVPSLSLLKQVRKSWMDNRLEDFHTLAVCSDEGVVDKSTVAEIGVPVTTDPAVIRKFMRKHGRKVVFSTYHSSPRLEGTKWDLVIADEAHRCVGAADSAFTTVLDDSRIKAERRLFMTATPRYINNNDEMLSMDDESAFGPVFHTLTFGNAIKQGLLCDYEIVISIVTNATYQQWVDDGEYVSLDTITTDARTLASQIGLALAMEKFGIRKAISFHSRVAWANKFVKDFQSVVDHKPGKKLGQVWSNTVSSNTGVADRQIILDAFRNQDGLALLSNVKVLGEGVDVPAIDGIAFVDAKQSRVDIVQAVGRAIRLSANKSKGYIVIPVFVDEEADIDETLNSSAFRVVWDVLKAMKAHDEELSEELVAVTQRGRRNIPRPRAAGHVQVIGARSIGADFLAAFEARAVEVTRDRAGFAVGFSLLQQFVAEHGHTRVPANYEAA